MSRFYDETLLQKYDTFAKLYIAVTKTPDSTIGDELLQKYSEYSVAHNKSLLENEFCNSGIDLFLPERTIIDSPVVSTMVSMGIKTEMRLYTRTSIKPSAFYLFPRSSMSKTSLSLGNGTGIFDSGYRGHVIGAFRSVQPYVAEKHDRLLQICHPSLCPIWIELVENESKLSTTSRGEGGFGSTGK